jgi:hypothetical protein
MSNAPKAEPAAAIWAPLSSAPHDGRPVWVRGKDWGDPVKPYHCVWAYFVEGEWRSAEVGWSVLHYLVEWLPSATLDYPEAKMLVSSAQ